MASADFAITIRSKVSGLSTTVRLARDSTWQRDTETPGVLNPLLIGDVMGRWVFNSDNEILVLRDSNGFGRVFLLEVPQLFFGEAYNVLELLEGGEGALTYPDGSERDQVTWDAVICN